MVIRGRGSFRPEMPAEMRRLERLKGVLPNEVFESVEHFSGVSDPQVADLLDVRPGRLADAVAQLNRGEDEARIAAAVARFNESVGDDEDEARMRMGALLAEANCGELLVRIPVYTGPGGEPTSNVALFEGLLRPAPEFHMNYVSTEGSIVIEHRDVSSLTAIRRRVYEDVRKDHNVYAPQLPHTLQQNDCIVALSRHGYLVSAGYRGSLYLPGGQQLVPDARLTVHLGLGELPTEFMRGAPWVRLNRQGRAEREEIRRQLMQYVPEVRRLGGLTVACLCENEAVIDVVKEEVVNIATAYDVPLHSLAVLERNVTVLDAAPDMPNFIRPLFLLFKAYLEYERSATTPAAIREKLMPYFRAVRRGYDCFVVFICETERAAEIFRQQHRNLQRELGVVFPLITSTYAEVTAGNLFDTCWNLDGMPVRLL